MHRVIEKFKDLQDNGHIYNVGDKFPHDGRKIPAKRISELASSKNKLKKVLIEEIKETTSTDEIVEELQSNEDAE